MDLNGLGLLYNCTFIISVKVLRWDIESDVTHQFTSTVIDMKQLDQVKEVIVNHDTN